MKTLKILLIFLLVHLLNCQPQPWKDKKYIIKEILLRQVIVSNFELRYMGSCNYIVEKNYCFNSYGVFSPEFSPPYENDASCSAIPGFGKSQQEPCPTENSVGACYIPTYRLEVYYAPEFTKTSAEERCKNGSNSTQEPPFGKRNPRYKTKFIESYDKNFFPSLNSE